MNADKSSEQGEQAGHCCEAGWAGSEGRLPPLQGIPSHTVPWPASLVMDKPVAARTWQLLEHTAAPDLLPTV